jgi:hypothetical protein
MVPIDASACLRYEIDAAARTPKPKRPQVAVLDGQQVM